MGDKFFLGTCSNCRQRAEVHEGTDGLAYCEDCLVMLGKNSETAQKLHSLSSASNPNVQSSQDRTIVRQEVILPKKSNPDNRRDELIDYIVSNADSNWIDKFLLSCKENYAWVSLIEQEPNERILLRYADELGYQTPKLIPEFQERQKVEHQFVKENIASDAISNFVKENVQTKESRPNKRSRGRPKGSLNRNRTEKESKSVSLSNP
jgi:hypothetical protein